MDKYRGADIGIVVECEGGALVIPDYSSARAVDKDNAEVKRFRGTSSHMANFLEAVRSRKYTDLKADILEGHLSSALCHTGNISYRLGKQRSPEEIKEELKGNADFTESLGRMQHHLAANNLDLEKSRLTLGEALKMDPKRERFTGNSKANQLLIREYRKPFVVPEKV
jgi:hypothetical protein